MTRIEISFPVDIDLDEDLDRSLHSILNQICLEYERQHPGRVMWVSGYGCKPNWSQADAAFLGRPVDPDAPASGEPTFDDAVYEITISEREDDT